MHNSPKFRLFSFHPTKLLEERLEVEKKFSNVEEGIVKIRSRVSLPNLLNKIRNTSIKELPKLIEKMTRMNVLLLIYDYPFRDESHETKTKINQILTSKYITLVGSTAWNLFQQDIHDPYLLNLLKNSYLNEKDTFLNLDQTFLLPMGKAMEDKEGILEGLVKFLVSTKYPSREVLNKWKVKRDSILEEKLISRMLVKGLFNDFIIKRDGSSNIAEILQQYPLDEYKKMIKIYLEARNRDTFSTIFLNQAIRRLLDPRERMDDWAFLSENALEEVKKWLIGNELEKFFQNDTNTKRFEYWKRYIDYMENVTPLKNPLVAFIYFKNFVVVEFGNIGAAYFYHKNGFEYVILPRTKNEFRRTSSNATRERLLKEMASHYGEHALFITKLHHSGNWQSRFDYEMRKTLIKFNE